LSCLEHKYNRDKNITKYCDIFVIYYFLSHSNEQEFMIEHNSLRYESNIAKILDRATELFRQTGLPELAEKWQKIHKNYIRARRAQSIH